MLQPQLAAQLKGYLDHITQPIVLAASLDGAPEPTGKSAELFALLDEIAGMSDEITLERRDDDQRRPSFVIERAATAETSSEAPSTGVVRFAGIPLGHEFASLVLALLHVGGHPSKAAPETIAQIHDLSGEYRFETYFSLSCQNCPDVVQALNLMSVLNPNITHVAIDGALFPDEVETRQVLAVPTVYLNGEPFDSGRMSLEQIVGKLDDTSGARDAARLDAKEPFDILVVGGGPAGASAAVYAARKGIRTGIAAERFGGQVLDTVGIENLISVPYTEGPKLAAALEAHVNEYDVDVMTAQRATRLVPATESGGLIGVELANGASLWSRSVVLSTGARWRHMGVPGEDEYRNRGVTYCPHCDGPLFKSKRVAVIGGGNSGVEAAIDLAGIVAHVTVVEFDRQLRADDVLLRKLHSLANVDVIVNAQTTEVHGDGNKVTGLQYTDRSAADIDRASHQIDLASHRIDLEGIFVQIGLLPNTDWLRDTVDLSPRGEIEIDDRCHTSVPGVFAAGDCTTVPYKQIVVALGAGSTAALGAFDYLIRTPQVAPDTREREAALVG